MNSIELTAKLTTVIRSLSRRKTLTLTESTTLRAAQLDRALLYGIKVSDCDLDLLASYPWTVTADRKVQTKIGGKRVYLGQLVMERVMRGSFEGVATQSPEAADALDYRRSSLTVAEKGQNYLNQLKAADTTELPQEYRGLFLQENGKWTASVCLSRRNGQYATRTDMTVDQAFYVLTKGYEAKADYYARCEAKGWDGSSVLPREECIVAMAAAKARFASPFAPEEAEKYFVSEAILADLRKERPHMTFENVRKFTTDDAKGFKVPQLVIDIVTRNRDASADAERRVEVEGIERFNERFDAAQANVRDILGNG